MMSSSSPAGNRPTGILNPAFEQETETMENNSVLAQKNLSSSFEETSSKDSSREPLFSFNVLRKYGVSSRLHCQLLHYCLAQDVHLKFQN